MLGCFYGYHLPLCLPPALADANIDRERDGTEISEYQHLLQEMRKIRRLRIIHLKEDLIMDREDHTSGAPRGRDVFIELEERELEHLSSSSLYRHIHCFTLGSTPQHFVGVVDPVYIPPSPQKCLDVSVMTCPLKECVIVSTHSWIELIKSTDKCIRIFSTQACRLHQTKPRDTVDNSEVDRLGDTALITGDLFMTKKKASRASMDIFSRDKRLDKCLIP